MKHDCVTDKQGRRACTCSNSKTRNGPGESAWDWIDAIPRGLDRALLLLVALAIVAAVIKFFHH